MIHAVDLVGADAFRAGVSLVGRHGGGFHERAVFPMATRGGDLANVDLGIKVGGKSVAVVAPVDINDVEAMHFGKVMLRRVGGEDSGDARVEAGAKNGGESCFLEPLLVSPLMGVFEFGLFGRFVVRGIEVVNSGGEAGLHEMEILVGESDVDEEFGLQFLQKFGGRGDIIRINRASFDRHPKARFDRSGNGVAFGERSRGEGDFRKNLGNLRAFMGHHVTDTSRTND